MTYHLSGVTQARTFLGAVQLLRLDGRQLGRIYRTTAGRWIVQSVPQPERYGGRADPIIALVEVLPLEKDGGGTERKITCGEPVIDSDGGA